MRHEGQVSKILPIDVLSEVLERRAGPFLTVQLRLTVATLLFVTGSQINLIPNLTVTFENQLS
jgi:hypothetical protein